MSKQDDKLAEEQLTDDVAPHAEEKVAGCDCENCDCGTCECEDCEKCQKIKSELDEMTAKYKRALADYQNLEKRVAEGRSELAAWAGAEVIKKILPVMDHFDKALGVIS